MLLFLIAAGFFFPVQGAVPTGRGGTGVAGPDDLSAFALNPAGLAAFTSPRIQGELSSAWQPIDFTRAGQRTTVSNSSGAFLNTVSGVAVPLGHGLVVGAAVYGPPSVGRENFPDPRVVPPLLAPQRYSLISENNLVLYPGVGAGWRALDWLDVGAVLQLRYFRVHQVQSLYSLGGIGGETPDLDAVATAEAVDPARLVFGLGAIARPLPGLSVGLSFRPAEPVHATGTLGVQLPSFAAAAGATVTGNGARVDLTLPPEARFGLRYDRGPASALADLTWENWGVLPSIAVAPVDVVLHQGGSDTKVAPIGIPKRWHASWTGRLGGEYEPLPWLRLRAGALYETGAIPDETLQIDFASLPRLAATAGLTARWRGLSVTAAYAHFFAQDRTVTTSQVTRIDPYPAPAFTIGNGRYATSLDVLGLQLAVTL